MRANNQKTPLINSLAYLTASGEMGDRIRTHDWSQTPLAAVEHWPQSLKTAVSIMLNSRYPMFLWWGQALTNLYNDAYIPVLGARHPQALGKSAQHIWADIWPVVGPQAELVLKEGRATWNESVLLMMERHGYTEETYFTFSYSPVPDDAGSVAGVFCACIEDTQRVIGERQLALLRELAATTANARTWQAACKLSAEALGSNRHDLPFALIYMAEPDGSGLHLAGASQIDHGHPAAPAFVETSAHTPWPFDIVLGSREVVVVENLTTLSDIALPTGAWPEPPSAAALVPIAAMGQTGRGGILVVGLNPYRVFDDDYRHFIMLLAGHISASIASAQAFEEETKRAEALAELDRAKTHFFSNVSHEFRTPLTLMIGPLEEMLEHKSGDIAPVIRERLDVVHRNSLRLLKLVNSLLDFSRIEASRIEASYEPVDLAAYTKELAGVFRATIEGAGLRFIVNCPPLPEPVYVDRAMWEKIVLNLLSNAFKFTLDGEIEVCLETTDRLARLTVRDTGIGIPIEEQPRIFERFHRISDSRGRTHEGSGIGLALVQELVHLHGGSVYAESVLDEGSRFIVTVPLGSAHLDPQRIGAPIQLAPTKTGGEAFVQEALHWLPGVTHADQQWKWEDGESNAERQGRRQDSAPQEVTTPHILWADDNADMREYVSRLLGEHYSVESVADGQAALEAARTTPPDLIISDIMMPRLDGYGLLREIRTDPQLQDIPIILLSARAGEEPHIEGIKAGADDYLIKPFNASELLARVESQLKMAAVRTEMKRALRASEERYRAIVEGQTEMVCRFRPDGTILFANGAYARARGSTPEALIHTNFWDFIEEEDRPSVRAMLDRLKPESPEVRIENRFETAEGIRWTLWTNLGLEFDDDGRATEVQSSGIDITDRRRAENALRRSEEEFRSLFELSAVGLAQADLATGQFVRVNRRFCEITGYSEAELQSKTFHDLIHPQDRDRNSTLVDPVMRGETDWWEIEQRYIRANGAAIWVHVAGRLVTDANNQPYRTIASIVDITDRKRAEASLYQANETLEDRVRERTRQVSELVRRLTLAEQEERRRISQILHDDLQQLLYGIEMKLVMIRKEIQTPELTRLANDLAEARMWLNQAVTTTRQLTVDLSPPILHNEGLVDALGWLRQQMRELHGLDVTVAAEDRCYIPDADLRVLLFHVIRELLFNIKKHADVDQALIRLAEESGRLVIHVIDQGKGFDTGLLASRSESSGGFGLFSIRERLSLLGGRTEIRSQPGKGTHIEIHTPVPYNQGDQDHGT